MNLPDGFPHKAPKGYAYEVKPFKRNMLAIWLQHPDRYNFSSDRVSTIWGFYNTKSGTYSAPVNATKCGDQVDICLLYTSPSPRDQRGSRMPSSA